MTVIEAFEMTMKKANELKKSGIKTSVIPYGGTGKTGKCEVPVKMWKVVKFSHLNKEQKAKILEAHKVLLNLGIEFDSSGSQDSRNWELDWAFNYIGVKNEERIETEEWVEELIENCGL